jgi:uncharacterized protein
MLQVRMRFVCPTCKRTIDGNSPAATAAATFRPFCSERCRLADLGSWLEGRYRIGGPLEDEDLDQGPPPGTERGGGSRPPGSN